MSATDRLTILHLDDGRAWGGGQQQVALLAREQSRAGHRVTVCCPAGSPLAHRAAADGLDCLPSDGHGRGLAGTARALRSLLHRVRPDVLHAHTSHAHGVARLAVPRRDRPLLVVSRRTCTRPGRTPWARWKYRSGVDLFIAVAGAVARVLAAGGVDPDRIRVAHSSVDPERLASPPLPRAEALRALELPREARVVAAVGGLVALKAHADLLEAFALLKARGFPHHLVIVGEGPLRGDLAARAAALGIAEQTRFPGFREDVARLLPHFDVVAQPSLIEGLPNAVLDALMAGVPVVATPAGGTREIVDHERTGGLIVPFRAPGRLAAAIGRLLAEPELAARLAAAGRSRVAETFVPGRMAAAVEAACRAALERRGRGGAAPENAGPHRRGEGLLAWGADESVAADLLSRAGRPGSLPGSWTAGARADAPRRAPGAPSADGRGPVQMVDLGGRAAVLKRHARGGLIGRVARALGPDVEALSLGRRRVVRLGEITRWFRARGGRTPAFLGWLEVAGRGPFRILYSATARVPGAQPLGSLMAAEPGARRRIVADLARHLAAWHHAGLRHPDLNSGNILGTRDPADGLWVIDLDRAGLRRDVGNAARARMLARLFRSLAHKGLEPRRRETLRLVAVYARERTLLEGVPHRHRRSLARRLLRGLDRRRLFFVLHGLSRRAG